MEMMSEQMSEQSRSTIEHLSFEGRGLNLIVAEDGPPLHLKEPLVTASRSIARSARLIAPLSPLGLRLVLQLP